MLIYKFGLAVYLRLNDEFQLEGPFLMITKVKDFQNDYEVGVLWTIFDN